MTKIEQNTVCNAEKAARYIYLPLSYIVHYVNTQVWQAVPEKIPACKLKIMEILLMHG